jgi:hypothetical protein
MVRSIFVCVLFIVVCDLSQAACAGDLMGSGKETEMSDYKGPKDTPRFAGKDFEILSQPYVEEARRTYPQAKARFQSGLPVGYKFLVTIVLHENKNRENAFMTVHKISDGEVFAVLDTRLIKVKSIQYGQPCAFPESDVIDWTILSPDGKEEGNFVGKFMDEYFRTHP